MMDKQSVSYALLATQGALLGAVTPQLRAVLIDVEAEEPRFFIYFYYDGEITANVLDLWECVITEASASMGFYCVTGKIERCDVPLEIPKFGYSAYLRKEPVIPKKMKRRVKIEKFSIAYALLAMQRALLGVVTPELRSVVVDIEEENQVLYVRFYYHGEVSLKVVQLWHDAIAEAHLDFAPKSLLDGKIERWDAPKKILFRGRYAYERQEID